MSKSVRKYEVLLGRNRYYCYGRCMTSKQVGVFVLALILIVGTTTLFFVFDCPYLSEKLSIAVPIAGAIIFLFVISILLRTACTDPGILPRTERDELSYYEKQQNIDSGTSAINQMPRFKEITIKGKLIKLKYCYTCKLYRPPRTSHCSICDNCVERFDHHCPWVGNCIGKRNYRYFYMFLGSLSILCVYIITFNIVHLVLKCQNSSIVDAVKETPATIVELIISFFSMWSVVCLCGYHTYLIGFERSTNEDIKESFSTKRGDSDVENPYDSGSVLKNFCRIVCGPMPPSLIDMRGKIQSKTQIILNNDKSDNRAYYSIHA